MYAHTQTFLPEDHGRSTATPAALAGVALLIVFSLVRPALKAATANAAAAAAAAPRLHVVADDGSPRGAAMPALEAPRNSENLESARAIAKQNPAAVANIVRTWVNGDTA